MAGEIEAGCRPAPFNNTMIRLLKSYQTLGYMPSYRCVDAEKHEKDGKDCVLVPHLEGLRCPAPGCSYVQKWAHEFILVESNMSIMLDELTWLETVASKEQVFITV